MRLPFVFCLVLLVSVQEQARSNQEEEFRNPPPAARPGVFWDWMGGLISREGITKDLEAMAAQGIGKVMLMQMPDQCPYPRQWSYSDYPGKVKVLSEEWFGLVNFSIGECDRLGLEMASFACPGWGHLGGPWVPADKGTKKMAVASVRVSGPLQLDMKLPKPAPTPVVSGGNQIPEWNFAHELLPEPKENFFRDEAVLALPGTGEDGAVPLNGVIDITDCLDANGRLVWEVPEGNWTITRICLISENGINHPAPPESLGLEVDRMDPDAVHLVFDNIIGRILREARAKGYQSFKAYETDSYETGFQDYGLDFRKEFEKRRGYDCISWLPAWSFQHSAILKLEADLENVISIAGTPVFIESVELTERFRKDMKRTISELWVERFQGTLRKLADEHGITWMTEPYFLIPLDWTSVGGVSTMPGAEFWVGEAGAMKQLPWGRLLGNAPEIAVLNNQKVVWAEAFTAESYNSAWRNDPWLLKRSGDAAFAHGINLFYMHGFVHNPFPDQYQPGLTMGFWGTQFSRHLTWWSHSHPWHKYLARCQHMLQQGRPVFHALRYPASFNPFPSTLHGLYRTAQLTDELLLEKLSVREGKLVLPHGAEFYALHLTGEALRPEALMKLKSLVEEGAVLIGDPPPRRSASLENYPACDQEAAALVDAIWGVGTHWKHPAVRSVGKGKVLSGVSLEQGMEAIDKLPDFIYETAPDVLRPELMWYQRKTDDGTYWFVCNQEYYRTSVNASFAVSGWQPEWWDPVDGSIRDLPEFHFKDGRTVIPLSLEPLQSGFVVFRKATSQPEWKDAVNFAEAKPVMRVSGPWEVSFDRRWGGPCVPVSFPQLSDWRENEDHGIKYYSGTAVYRKVLDLPSSVIPSSTELSLDLGTVHDLAQVTLNGKNLGTVWCAPWRVRVPAGLLEAKGNELEITIVNNWCNRLIGDEQEPDDFETEPGNQTGDRLGSYDINVKARGLKDLPDWLLSNTPRPSRERYTFTSWFFYDKDAPLQPAGLLGPVQIVHVPVPPKN